MALTPCSDLSAADWIAADDQPWHQLIGFGPAGFPAYARLRFLPDPAYAGQSENDAVGIDDGPPELMQLRAVLAVLARHTSTPQDCYFCLWDGWGWTVGGGEGSWSLDRERPVADDGFSVSVGPPAPGAVPAAVDRSGEPAAPPSAPKVVLPHRAYFLFRAAMSEFGEWGAAPTGPDVEMPVPAFIWPADHAWCVARDVDPHWAGIGAGAAAIDQLLADPALDVVSADPWQDQPEYR